MRMIPRLAGLSYGGDYNPEQWPDSVWPEDVKLMREAGVTLATVGVFSWAHLETAPGVFDFGWLDRVLELLHAHDVKVDLATATASPPPWFSHAHPQTLPVDAGGHRLSYGSRQAYCPSSPVYRAAAVRLAQRMAERYRDHPALVLWHVGNEYGCHVARCYCDISAEAFRGWLRRRYGDSLDALNAAWGTAFWSQRYTAWAEILPPRRSPTWVNPTQELDFHRFSSDELLDCFRAERDVLHRICPGIPVTTNLMAGLSWEMDYWTWAPELDLVSTDHYLVADGDIPGHLDLAFAADLTRSLAGGRPWLLMEHSTGAVNWQPRNLAKEPGEMRRNSLGHVARGSDGAMFFQWRASVAGAEKYHSAMVPHAGTGTRIWREVVGLGADLAALAEVAGSEVEPPAVALLLDWSSLWAGEEASHPSDDMTGVPELKAWYAALWRAGITPAFAHPRADLSGYRLVLAPALYLLDDAGAANVRSYVDSGGVLVLGPFSAVVDENDHVRPGGYPAALRDVLGLWVEEFQPLPAGGTVELDDGSTGRVWTELIHLEGAQVQARYGGRPAITRHRYGRGEAWYLATRLDRAGLDRWLARITGTTGVTAAVGAVPSDVEAVRRRHPDGPAYLFLINHNAADVHVPGTGTDLLTGTFHDGRVRVPGRGVAVLREMG